MVKNQQHCANESKCGVSTRSKTKAMTPSSVSTRSKTKQTPVQSQLAIKTKALTTNPPPKIFSQKSKDIKKRAKTPSKTKTNITKGSKAAGKKSQPKTPQSAKKPRTPRAVQKGELVHNDLTVKKIKKDHGSKSQRKLSKTKVFEVSSPNQALQIKQFRAKITSENFSLSQLCEDKNQNLPEKKLHQSKNQENQVLYASQLVEQQDYSEKTPQRNVKLVKVTRTKSTHQIYCILKSQSSGEEFKLKLDQLQDYPASVFLDFIKKESLKTRNYW